jgi:hypothetical protein
MFEAFGASETSPRKETAVLLLSLIPDLVTVTYTLPFLTPSCLMDTETLDQIHLLQVIIHEYFIL